MSKNEAVQLLSTWEEEYRAGFSWADSRTRKAFEMLIPLVKKLLEAQKMLDSIKDSE